LVCRIHLQRRYHRHLKHIRYVGDNGGQFTKQHQFIVHTTRCQQDMLSFNCQQESVYISASWKYTAKVNMIHYRIPHDDCYFAHFECLCTEYCSIHDVLFSQRLIDALQGSLYKHKKTQGVYWLVRCGNSIDCRVYYAHNGHLRTVNSIVKV